MQVPHYGCYDNILGNVFGTWKRYLQFALVHSRKAEAPTCLEMHSSYVSRQLTTIYTVIYS